jgi:hypothetical protein
MNLSAGSQSQPDLQTSGRRELLDQRSRDFDVPKPLIHKRRGAIGSRMELKDFKVLDSILATKLVLTEPGK